MRPVHEPSLIINSVARAITLVLISRQSWRHSKSNSAVESLTRYWRVSEQSTFLGTTHHEHPCENATHIQLDVVAFLFASTKRRVHGGSQTTMYGTQTGPQRWTASQTCGLPIIWNRLIERCVPHSSHPPTFSFMGIRSCWAALFSRAATCNGHRSTGRTKTRHSRSQNTLADGRLDATLDETAPNQTFVIQNSLTCLPLCRWTAAETSAGACRDHAQYLYTAPGPRRYPALQRGGPGELPRAHRRYVHR